MNPAMGAHDGAVMVADSGVPSMQGTGLTPVQDTGVTLVQDAGIAPVQDTGVAAVQDASVTLVQDTGVAQDTGVVDTGPAPLPPCPTGYTCQDPGAMIRSLGASGGVTDPDGGTVALSCGKGGVMNCDQKNPKTSCPDFVNPFCAHLVIEFPPLDTWTCAQRCTK
jgi:hypothetical protein